MTSEMRTFPMNESINISQFIEQSQKDYAIHSSNSMCGEDYIRQLEQGLKEYKANVQQGFDSRITISVTILCVIVLYQLISYEILSFLYRHNREKPFPAWYLWLNERLKVALFFLSIANIVMLLFI